MTQQLERMIDVRVTRMKKLLSYVWENRKKLIQQQKAAYKEGNGSTLHEAPWEYLPDQIYRKLTTDDVDKLNEILCDVIELHKGKLTKSYLIDAFLPAA